MLMLNAVLFQWEKNKGIEVGSGSNSQLIAQIRYYECQLQTARLYLDSTLKRELSSDHRGVQNPHMATSSIADCARDAPSLSASAQPFQNGDKDGEDDGETCRICRNPGSSDDPLCYPCACRGSIRFVHEECLLQWLNRSPCEVMFLLILFLALNVWIQVHLLHQFKKRVHELHCHLIQSDQHIITYFKKVSRKP